ncbi:MAG: APC family permease [Dehalococcoidia bacterium]|nr:APC family permease [Dehalococcoidia bacterium]
MLAGSKIGSPRARVQRTHRLLRFARPSHWVATLAAEAPDTALGRLWRRVRYRLFGTPLASARELSERLSKKKALAIFASDALSSTAYATEEILVVLVLLGGAYLYLALPIAVAITLLLATVIMSYRQTVRAYPHGGGAYLVSSENLGRVAGALAAAALLTDYVLTVAVSISAGMLAAISAFGALAPYRVEIAVVALWAVALINLRGTRESGTVFAIPTYIFIGMFAAMLAAGLARLALGGGPGSLTQSAPPRETLVAVESLGMLLLLRAFSSGATALTGVEAIADGVMAFKPPEERNAATTMAWMGVILGTFFVGATFLAVREGVVPLENVSVISQIGRIAFGGATPPYYVLQVATALILVLAANTAFNGFPALASILAADGYMPRQFSYRGDRLSYSYGIVALGLVATTVLVIFGADTHRLIPLYAVGVFVAFTLAQAGLTVRWYRRRHPGWWRAAAISGGGAAATGIVTVIVSVSKFTHGAWVVLLLIPAFVWGLWQIHRHYARIDRALAIPEDAQLALAERSPTLGAHPVVVPVREINLVSLRAIEYARSLSRAVTAVHVVRASTEATAAFEERWRQLVSDVPLAVVESPYRSFLGPFMAFINALPVPPEAPLTIVVPEFRPDRWWQWFLHNRTGDRIEHAVAARPGAVVTRATVGIRGLQQFSARTVRPARPAG